MFLCLSVFIIFNCFFCKIVFPNCCISFLKSLLFFMHAGGLHSPTQTRGEISVNRQAAKAHNLPRWKTCPEANTSHCPPHNSLDAHSLSLSMPSHGRRFPPPHALGLLCLLGPWRPCHN